MSAPTLGLHHARYPPLHPGPQWRAPPHLAFFVGVLHAAGYAGFAARTGARCVSSRSTVGTACCASPPTCTRPTDRRSRATGNIVVSVGNALLGN